ncbi:Poly(ADP-ribose) glycohydrolase, partial [Orchesella cincta]
NPKQVKLDMDEVFAVTEDSEKDRFTTTYASTHDKKSPKDQLPKTGVGLSQENVEENAQGTTHLGTPLTTNIQNDQQTCNAQVYENSCTTTSETETLSCRPQNDNEKINIAPRDHDNTIPVPENIPGETNTISSIDSIAVALANAEMSQVDNAQSVIVQDEFSENNFGKGTGIQVQADPNMNKFREDPPKHLIYPEVSEITPDLAQKIASNPNLYTAVFYHQFNVDMHNIQEVKLEHHDGNWDNLSFVRSAFSNRNSFVNHRGAFSIWDKIKQSLTDLVKHTKGAYPENPDILMQNALSRYDVGVQGKTDFITLTHPDIKTCMATTIPIIVQHALKLPSLLATPIPFLKAHTNKTLYMTKKLVGSLLANAFFCTLPKEKEDMPDINFHRMFNTAARGQAKAEKLKCVLNYFQQLGLPGQNAEKEDQIISFERRFIPQKVNWSSSSTNLTKVDVEPNKKIEEAHGTLQVDFANKRVGGGVLNEGAVMEEILFVVCPELIISRLFTETLEDDEVLVITGFEQFSNYAGYSRSFHFTGPTKPVNHEVDNLGRTCTQIVVMDALHFGQYEIESQFEKAKIDRELHKAFVAFVVPHGEPNIPVATGNWGCGAFNGDPELKFLIQWIAASEAGRNLMVYHTIGNTMQTQAIKSMDDFLHKKNVNNGELYRALVSYQKRMGKFSSIFDYVRSVFNNK